MTIFVDGRAEGARLSLSRSPHFLRVVVDAYGRVDALDQINDEARRKHDSAHLVESNLLVSASFDLSDSAAYMVFAVW